MRNKLTRLLKTSVIVLCVLFASFCAYHLFYELKDYNEAVETYREVEENVLMEYTGRQDYYIPPTAPDAEGENAFDAAPAEQLVQIPEPDFAALQAINVEGIAWIYQPDTKINYPIAQAEDNTYYLKHNIKGKQSSGGAIFLDYRNAEDFSDRVSVLYGHHMQSGSMFASIDKYRKQAYYNAHPIAYLITPLGCWRIEFFAGAVHTAEEVPLEYEDDAVFIAYMAALIENSTFMSYVPVTVNSRVIALSTCAYDFRNARFILYGVLQRVW